MKTQVKTIALTVLLISAIAVTATNRNNKIQTSQKHQSCLTDLPGLTDTQSNKIKSLEDVHNEKMDALRTERRSTTDQNKKDKIRANMLIQRSSHRTNVESLLTDDQKEVYTQLHETGNKNLHASNKGNNNGNRQGKGQGQGVRQGNSNQHCSGNNQQYASNSQRGNRNGNGSGKGYNQSNSCRR